MAKQKLFGVLETDSVLLEPVSETRYHLDGRIAQDLVGCWVTISGDVNNHTVVDVEVTSVEKNSGKSRRTGTIVAMAPNLPAEANGAGGYLYQEKKGRYYLLSSGGPDEPIQGDFGVYTGADVKVTGEFAAANYILYNVRVLMK